MAGEGIWAEEEGIYSEEGIMELEEDDEISMEESGFMMGYMGYLSS